MWVALSVRHPDMHSKKPLYHGHPDCPSTVPVHRFSADGMSFHGPVQTPALRRGVLTLPPLSQSQAAD